MNGLSFFGLNFLFLGAGSAYAFSFRFPLVLVSLLFISLGFIMIWDDLNRQRIGQWVLRHFPGTKPLDELYPNTQPANDNRDKSE